MSEKSTEKQDRSGDKKAKKSAPEYGCVPSWFWYTAFGSWIVINACRLFYGIRIKADKEVKKLPGPLVIVGNHPSYIDPILMGTALYGRPINFVAGEFLFRRKIFGHIITKGGCIPKAQYRNDVRTVKAMFRVLSRGGVLGIFPEGTRLTDGHSIDFEPGLATLIKRAGAGLVVFRSHGAYMTWPRWSKDSRRKGRITGEFTRVIPKEEIEKMSVDEVYATMKKELEYDEYEYFSDHIQEFKSKIPAEGVENVANICPKCEGINTTSAVKDLLTCRVCGNQVVMNKRGFFEPKTPEDKCFSTLHQWTQWEKTIYEREIGKPDYCLTEKVELHQHCGIRDYAKVGTGVLTIKDGVITYEGTLCAPEEGILYKKGKPVPEHADRDLSKIGKPVKKEFPIRTMKGILMDFGKYMEIYEASGQENRIVPENPQRLYEIQSIVSAMKKKLKEEDEEKPS